MGYYNMQRPEARGEMTLKSADPFAHPAIQPNYLQNKTDLRTLRDGLKILAGFFAKRRSSLMAEKNSCPALKCRATRRSTPITVPPTSRCVALAEQRSAIRASTFFHWWPQPK